MIISCVWSSRVVISIGGRSRVRCLWLLRGRRRSVLLGGVRFRVVDCHGAGVCGGACCWVGGRAGGFSGERRRLLGWLFRGFIKGWDLGLDATLSYRAWC